MLLDLRFLYEQPAAPLKGGGRVYLTTMHPPLPVVGRGSLQMAAPDIKALGRTTSIALIALLLADT